MDGELEEKLRREVLLYYSEIRDELCRAVSCWDLGEDLAQETYFRALAALARRSRPRNVRAWLEAIARNVLRDHFRRARLRLRTRDLDLVSPDEVSLVAERAAAEVDTSDLIDLVATLPPVTQALVVGFYFEHKGCAELSSELGIRTGTVRVQLHRARNKLRERLARNGGRQ